MLEAFVRNARRGGTIAMLEGEAGIGKTRLVEASIAAAGDAGVRVLSSRAEELEAYRPFGAIVDLVGSARLEADLGAADLGADAAGERQFRVAERVLELLEELCNSAPVLVIVEDIHWADATSLAVLARVAAGIERLPVALIVTARPQPRRQEAERLLGVLIECGARQMQLGPLDDACLSELLRGLLDAAPGPRLVSQARRAGGNPLFVTELVWALDAGGAIARRGATAELTGDDAAPSLSVTILHRLSFLERDVLDLLELASVLGASFAAVDLALLTGRPVAELAPLLLAACRAGVLAEQGERLAFRHELIRDALYQDIPVSVRRGLHAQLADAFAAAGEPPERIAEHLVRAAGHGDERAIRSLIDAARALVARAPGAAVDLYDEAIRLSLHPRARRQELLPELALALVAAGRLTEGETACREALSEDPEAEWIGRLWPQLMLLLLRRARTAEAVSEGNAALRSHRLAGVDRSRVRALVAMARAFQGEGDSAAVEARALIAECDDEVTCALATNTVAVAAAARGRFTEAAELMAPSVRWADRTVSRAAHDTRPHMIRGNMLARVDRLDEARATYQRGRRGAEALGIADALPIYHFQIAFIDFLQGRLDDAGAELQAHAELAAVTGIGWFVPTESLRALIAIHREDLLAAQRHVEAAELDVSKGGPPQRADLMVLARARVLEATGQRSAALETTAAAYESAVARDDLAFVPVIGVELARLAAGTAQPSVAGDVVPLLEEIAGLNPDARSLAAAPLQARGVLERDADALLAAVTLLRGTGRKLETARAIEDAAEIADRERDLLDEARTIYERCDAARDVARVESALRRLGARRGVSGRRRARPSTGWGALTDTELKVVRLVAERLTNPEIAERMFISRRTVQTHVSHALAKLGVATRRDLADEAALHGWRFRADDLLEDAHEPEPALKPMRGTAVDAHDT